jgi:plastocyanin
MRETQRTQRGQRTHREGERPVPVAVRSVLTFVSLSAVVFFAFFHPSNELGAARNGVIRGRVELRRVVPQAERRPGVSDLGGPAAREVDDRLRSVVYLESAPRRAFEVDEGGHAVMDQRNETFVPHLLAVMTGTTVDFPNTDKFYHNVFSLSKAARFDLGRYAAGHSRSIRFDRPGIVRVFCDIHSHMNAFILVFSHPYFAVTDNQGRYHIDNVPPGTYGVIAWNEGNASDSRPAIVPDGGTAELDFTLR